MAAGLRWLPSQTNKINIGIYARFFYVGGLNKKKNDTNLYLHRLERILNRHREALIPHRVEVSVHYPRLVQQSPHGLELHVRVASAWQQTWFWTPQNIQLEEEEAENKRIEIINYDW